MAGIIHPYYTVALVPPIGALTGIGAVLLWRERDRPWARLTLAGATVVTAAWGYVLLDRTPGWLPWLRGLVMVTGSLAAALVLAAPALARRAGPAPPPGPVRFGALAALAVPLALISALAGPAAYSIDTAATAYTGALPSAGPAVASSGGPGGGGPGGTGPGGARIPGGGTARGGTGTAGGPPGQFPGGTASAGANGSPRSPVASGQAGGPGGTGGLGGDTRVAAALTRLLRSGAAGYRWAAATVGSESAAPLQLASGDPVMAIGGFNGTDGAPTLAEFQRLVAAGAIHYFVGASQASFGGGSGAAEQITAWVRARFTAETAGGVTVYDLSRAR
jgi:hypothetical protein